MEWPAWPRAIEKDLPRYVTVGARHWLPLELSQFDNRDTPEGRKRIAESIYNSLLKKGIRYAQEKYHPSERQQEIRSPGEIFGEREGTCLDLALLFCGLCMASELLPMLIITEGHAFAAVSLAHGLRGERNSIRPGRALFETEPLSDTEQKAAYLRQWIDEGSWLAVECTGFAYSEKISAGGGKAPPESLGRENGLMTFERATAAGREQLDYEARRFQFAFDIAVAHYHWEVAPYQTERPKETNALRTSYLNRLFEDTKRLSLLGIDPKAAGDPKAELNLDAVYTALLTLTPKEHERMEKEGMTPGIETRRLSALALLNKHKRLVLLGDPGSGKTTFVNFVAMCMAGENLGKHANLELLTAPLPEDEGNDQEERQPWDHGPLLPVRIILRDFAARGLPSVDQPATADHLWDFIEGELGKTLAEYARYLKDELLEEGGLILLDGLDEVTEADLRRGQIKQVVEGFASAFPKCRVLVTSRTYAYQKQQWRLPSFSESVLASFSKGQIHRFVDQWYTHIGPLRGLRMDEAQGQAERLKRAIFGSYRLLALAERPLLLTLMASLHAWRGGSLPEKREELYEVAVDLLLHQWETQKIRYDRQGRPMDVEPSISEYLATGRDVVQKVLEKIASTAHLDQPYLVGTADISQVDLVDKLMDASKNPDARPARLIEYLSNRAGLLLPRGQRLHTFAHRTFQEYLAACYLTVRDFPNMVAELARRDPDRWREVALLAGAKAARGSPFAMWALVEELCSREPNEGEPVVEDVWGAHLAGLMLAETADLKSVGRRDISKLERVKRWHVRILKEGLLPATERVTAGNTLARLGDPRFPSDRWYLPVPDEPLLGFVEIPKGPFQMGSDKTWREIPQHTFTLPQYYIARYPVTVAQFKAFVEDSKYQVQNEESLKGMDNHPVSVTWHVAMKYCEWLTDTLRKWEGTPEPLATLLRTGAKGGPPWRFTLPSEAEWEKAARGTDGRIYPWGDNPDPNRANYGDSNIGTTSAVGCFPGGASPYECLDMSGNVWEWTRSLYGRYPYPYDERERKMRENLKVGQNEYRVLRGGAFRSFKWDVRCAYRDWDYPWDYRYFGLSFGFRVVVSL